jgi:hypothetical protein
MREGDKGGGEEGRRGRHEETTPLVFTTLRFEFRGFVSFALSFGIAPQRCPS